MAPHITNSFVPLILLALITKGFCQTCTLNDIHIGGVRTGNVVGGKPEWKITVSNDCRCPQSLIRLDCRGFRTTEAVDPDIVKVLGDGTCLFVNGKVFNQGQLSFYIAWDTPTVFLPVSSRIQC